MKLKVGVIGAGATGLISAKWLSKSGFDFEVFEVNDRIGGTWIYSENLIDKNGLPVSSSMYKSLFTNLPKELMLFEGLEYDSAESFLPAEKILNYLQTFSEKFNLISKIKFEHFVEKVSRVNVENGDKRWELIAKDLKTGKSRVYIFDSIFVCNGHYCAPFYIEISGSGSFPGSAIHSHYYKVPEPYRDKIVLVTGSGPSALDITYDLAPYAKRIYLSHHGPDHLKVHFPGNVVHQEDVKFIDGDKIHFKNDIEVQVEAIIYCSGYKYDFPFLDKSCEIEVDGNYVHPLYKQFVSIPHSSMFFIGLPHRSFLFQLFELQAKCAVNILLGTAVLPEKSEMEEDTRRWVESLSSRNIPKRMFHNISSYVREYFNDITNLGQLKPLPDTMIGDYHYTEDATFATRAIHDGQNPDQWTSGIIVPPIHLGVIYKQDGPGLFRSFDYGRTGNPSRSCLEACLASLDSAKHGLTFTAGSAALLAFCSIFKVGDHFICAEDVYSGTSIQFKNFGKNRGHEVDFVDTTDIDNVIKAIKPNTKAVFLENPTNPLLKVTDIPRLARAVKTINDKILIAVDNTFLTPYVQKPLFMGADIVMYSLTKFVNGHSDIIMGAITLNDEEIFHKLHFVQNEFGLTPSPFDCYMVCRSLKTLSLRMEKHNQNAAEVAAFLDKHPFVERVLYPGLPSHPQYELAKQMWKSAGGMIAAYLKGGLRQSTAFLKSLKVFTLAVSLGDVESLAQIPSVMTHSSLPAEVKKQLMITDNLIRISVGLESSCDLIQDLSQALQAAAAVK